MLFVVSGVCGEETFIIALDRLLDGRALGPDYRALLTGDIMTRDELLAAIASRIADYRIGEWSPGPSPAHVDKWISQFDASQQLAVLAEMDHVLEKLYISRDTASGFLTQLASNETLTGARPSDFWTTVGVLNIQSGGESQRDMVKEFNAVLQKAFGYSVNACRPSSGVFVYLDDAIFTGTRISTDLASWIGSVACPVVAHVHVIVMGMHRGGSWHARQKIESAATASRKTVQLTFWRAVELEDRRRYINDSDVLRPMQLPPDSLVARYAQSLANQNFPVELRTTSTPGQLPVFSSAEARDVLEREMLRTGAYIRSVCTNLPPSMRPLGFTGLRTLGFGSTLVTYRNCPNTCPLAFWVDSPWYPLFPRRTNTESGFSGATWG